MTLTLCTISGEASGDIYAGLMIQQIKQQHPDWNFTGIGMQASRAAGMQIWPEIQFTHGLFGFRLLGHLRHMRQQLSLVLQRLERDKPDALILIDYGGFNLRVLKGAKALGIPCFFYIPPKTWAWGESRLKHLKLADHVAVLYAFEADYFAKHLSSVSLVKHPYLEQATHPSTTRKVIALFPGSRPSEIKSLMPVLLETALQLKSMGYADYQFDIHISSEASQALIDTFYLVYQHRLNCRLVLPDQRQKAMKSTQLALACSGTVTFEIALHHCPMIICYQTNRLTYWIAKYLVKIKAIGLPNLCLQAMVVPELIQKDCNPDKLSKLCQVMLDSPQKRSEQIKAFQTLTKQYTQTNVAPIGDTVIQFMLRKKSKALSASSVAAPEVS